MPKKLIYEKLEKRIQELEQAESKYKRNERALQEGLDKYRAIINEIPLLICSFLPGGEISLVNSAYCDYFDKTLDELVGSNFLSLIPDADQKTVMNNISALTVELPTLSHEHSVIAPNGDIRWHHWTNRAIFDATSKQIQDANPATLDLFGYSKEDFVNLTVEDLSAEKDKTKSAVKRIISGDSENKYIPLRYFIKKDGVIFPGEIYAGTFIFNGRKKIIGAVRDITNRMRAEEAIRELSFSLWAAQEMERKRIASELHDDLGQTLAFLKIQIKNIQNKFYDSFRKCGYYVLRIFFFLFIIFRM